MLFTREQSGKRSWGQIQRESKKKRRLKVAERSNVEGENGEWIAGVEGE